MTPEQIIQWAREAGVSFGLPPDAYKEQADVVIRRLQAFATLVRNATLEEAAGVCEEKKIPFASYFEINERLNDAATAIRSMKS